jgi:hypothetical protein
MSKGLGAAVDSVDPEGDIEKRAEHRDEEDEARPGNRGPGVALVEDRVARGDEREHEGHHAPEDQHPGETFDRH